MTARLALALALVPGIAAAERVPISALPQGVQLAREKLPVPADLSRDDQGQLVTPRGCFAPYLQGLEHWTEGGDELDMRWRVHEVSVGKDPVGLERLEQRGSAMVLERTKLALEDDKLVALERGRIALRPVGEVAGVVVYAFRRADHVLLVALTGGQGSMRSDSELAANPNRGADCWLVTTEMYVVNGSSQAVQMMGSVPGSPAYFVIDASVSKTSRDREPLLSVTARKL